MARFKGKFEVKRETSDRGKIKLDDNNYEENGGKRNPQQKMDFEDFWETGFDDIDFVEEKSILENLSETEKNSLITGYMNSAIEGELDAKCFIGSQSKHLGVEKEELENFLKKVGKEEIKTPNKVLHYHRTSLKYAKQIIESGYLLNRKNIALNGGDISQLRGSSSANVQFTRDIYNENGMLQSSGFKVGENKGANSMEVVFVMNPKLMEEESYNCFYRYPITEKADIKECCATILAQNIEIQEQIDKCLADKGFSIPTMLQEEFNREEILANLSEKEKDNDLQKDFDDGGNQLQDIGTHEDCVYQYTNEIARLDANSFNLYCDYLVDNDIDMTEEGQKEFMGKALGEEYAKLFDDNSKQQLAQLFGKLDYESLYDTKMNYNENFVEDTHQKYLLGLQQMETADGNVFVAQYEESIEAGEPFQTVYQYYTLDENGALILLENEPKFEQEQPPIVCLTQSEIADKLKKREDILIQSDKKVLEGVSKKEEKSDTTKEQQENLDKEQMPKDSFEMSLLSAGFSKNTVESLKGSIQTVSPEILSKMDEEILLKTDEQNMIRGGKTYGSEQDVR